MCESECVVLFKYFAPDYLHYVRRRLYSTSPSTRSRVVAELQLEFYFYELVRGRDGEGGKERGWLN